MERLQRLHRIGNLDVDGNNMMQQAQVARVLLPSVKCLDLSPFLHEGDAPVRLDVDDIVSVVRLLPNLVEVDFSRVSTSPYVFQDISTARGRGLSSIKCNGAPSVCLSPLCSNGRQAVSELTELQLDGAHAMFLIVNLDVNDRAHYLWMHCRRLERLSIKNSTWCSMFEHASQPFSQEMLIKLVRCHPTLRWLRSDLTDENMAMLRAERPELTLLN